MVSYRHEVAAGMARLEGYLRAQTEMSNARAEAEAFASRLPWLTTAQHDEVVRLYTEERIALARQMLQRIVDRTHELRAEYTARYEQLRRRLLTVTVALLLTAFALCCVPLVFARTL